MREGDSVESVGALRGALFGCGHVSVYHLRAWRQVKGVEIVALANRTVSKAESRAREFGISLSHVYGDHQALLQEEELDFVDIATAPHVHRRQVEDAARHRVNVLCQKPFAPTLADARAMIAACDQAGVLLSINENWRWRSWYRKMKRMLDEGMIGRPTYARMARHTNATLPRPDGTPPQLFTDQAYTGQMEKLIVYEWGIHLVDVLRFLFGEVSSLYARMDRISELCQGEDRAILTLDVGGVACLIDISWATVVGKTRESQLEQVTVEGDRGSLKLLPDQEDVLQLTTYREQWRQPAFDVAPDEAYQASYTAAQRHFAQCLRLRRRPETDAVDNFKTLAATLAAYESAARNQPAVPEKLDAS